MSAADTPPYKIYFNRSGLQHDTGPSHPESVRRLETLDALFSQPLFTHYIDEDIYPADYDQITAVHTEDHFMLLEDRASATESIHLDADTIMSAGSLKAACDAAGAACQAVDCVLDTDTKTKRVFCATRPPGHHAEPDKPMGFCLLNNIAIAAKHAQDHHGIKRIAIIDFDVHHGNGTDSFARRHEGIFYVSSHQSPLYPGTGAEIDNIPGKILNKEIQAGAGSDDVRTLYTEDILPAIDAYRPELIMISAGFDAHKDDPLANLNLETDDFHWLTAQICALADTHCGGRVISVLEGGYDFDALRASTEAHLCALFQL